MPHSLAPLLLLALSLRGRLCAAAALAADEEFRVDVDYAAVRARIAPSA